MGLTWNAGRQDRGLQEFLPPEPGDEDAQRVPAPCGELGPGASPPPNIPVLSRQLDKFGLTVLM